MHQRGLDRFMSDQTGSEEAVWWTHGLELDCLELTGRDRTKFLHNFCTAEVRQRVAGESCEAMILNERGKLLGLVQLVVMEDTLQLLTSAGHAATLRQHLERYVIREDVRFSDRTAEFKQLFVFPAEPRSIDVPTGFPGPGQWNRLPGGQLAVASTAIAGPGWVVMAEWEQKGVELVSQPEVNPRLRPASNTDLELHRIQSGCPRFGVDCDGDSLPQELRRDRLAISFTKGCYLGQETVARIDALGHVNRWLVMVRSHIPAPAPSAGSTVLADGRETGRLTSVATDNEGGWWGLATVRRVAGRPGQVLDCAGQAAVVVDFPVAV
jgi:folate-binding protein YgfZ